MISLKNKKSMSVSIVLLVLMAIVLVITSLFVFGLRQDRLNYQLRSFNGLQDVYAEAEALDYFLNGLMQDVEINAKSQSGAIQLLQMKIDEYKDSKENYFIYGLNQVRQQLDSNHVNYENAKLKVNFEILFAKQYFDPKNPKNLIFKSVYTHNFVYG